MDKPLCLIPARGGSKRFPRKNIAPLMGKPLLAYTITTALQSQIFDRVMVSTEDAEIAAIAQTYGAVVPRLRPDEYATDKARIVDVCLYTLDMLENEGQRYEVIVALQPTCPLRTAADIQSAWELFVKAGAAFLVSITDFDHPPFWALRRDASDRLTPVWQDYFGRQTQNLPEVFRPNGAIAIAAVQPFKREKTFYGGGVIGYYMPRWRSIDIDEPEDLALAECLMEKKLHG